MIFRSSENLEIPKGSTNGHPARTEGMIPANAPPLYNPMHTRGIGLQFIRQINEILCSIPLINIVFDV